MIKQHKSLDVFQVVITLILSSFLLILTLYKPLNQDEGVFLTIGRFLHNGVLPYRDIFDHKAPGIYLLNYIILGITTNIVFIKIIFVAINLCSVVLVTKIYQKISSNVRYIYLPAIFYLIMLIIFEGNFLITEIPMIFCLLLALNFALQNNKNYFLIGLFCGLAIIFKQTAIVSSVIIIFYSILRIKNNIPQNQTVVPSSTFVIPAQAGIQIIKKLLSLILGFGLPFLAILIYLISNEMLNEAVNQIISLNLCCYPGEPIGSVLKSLSFYFWHILPILILATIGIYFSIMDYRNSKKLLLVILLAILPVPFFFVRHYPHYWIQILPFLAVLASLGLEKLLSSRCHSRPVSEYGINSGGNPDNMPWIPGLLSRATSLNPRMTKISAQSVLNIQSIILTILIFASIALMFVSNFRWFRWQFSQKYIEQYHEQYQAISYLEANNLNEIIAENQFSFFSFYNSSKPLSKYLYITEINNQNNLAEEQTIETLRENRNIVVFWPEDQNYTSAKKLQQYILENYQKKKVFPKLGLVIYIRK